MLFLKLSLCNLLLARLTAFNFSPLESRDLSLIEIQSIMVGLIKLKGKIESFRVSFKAFQSLKGLIKANKIPTGNGPYGNRSTFYHVSLQLFPLDGIFYWIYTGNNDFCIDASPSYFRLTITGFEMDWDKFGLSASEIKVY